MTQLSYETAKRLKEVGFPGIVLPYCSKGHTDPDPFHHLDGECVDVPGSYPFLEHLIEACGEDFGSVALMEDTTLLGESLNIKREWMAFKFVSRFDDEHVPISTKGPTPSEAVAELWLKLNPKK